MRRKFPAGVLMALVLLIPAAPVAAHAAEPGLDAACQTVERKTYRDLRTLITIDLDTADDTQVQILAAQILTAANAESLPIVSDEIKKHLNGPKEELRAFLKDRVLDAWTVALRITVLRTLTDAGANVEAAAQKTLDDGSVDVMLAYLNAGLYSARELDCASQPTPTPTVTATATASPSATATAAPVTTSSASAGADAVGGDGGGLPVTGAAAGTVAAVGGALLLLGGAGYLIGRRRRSRFVA